jgi:calcineurin-like phosphoesterase
MRRQEVLDAFLTQMPVRYQSAEEDPWLNAVLVRCSQSMRADAIEQLLRPVSQAVRTASPSGHRKR